MFFLIVRCFSGVSAIPYFQQTVNYRISVTLNDKKHELHAFEEVEYINNSPDTLLKLYFHLWPNAYANNRTELAKQLFSVKGKQRLFRDRRLKGYIDSLDFKSNGSRLTWKLSSFTDGCEIILDKPLKPGDTVKISTPFHVKIPLGVTSRLGHIGESYQISQWYPKPAVYDNEGWHHMPYLDQGEFYSEFGSFDVSITLPSNYTVGSTGDLANPDEKERLDKMAADTSLTGNKDKKNIFPPSSKIMKTLRYRQDNIHDFAWFADKRFHVLRGKLILPGSGKEITTQVMYTNEQASLWKNALNYVNNAISSFSQLVGDYPYNTFTAVQSALSAGSGMEYPGITVVGIADDAWTLDEIIVHEVGHSWFYAALGFNERRYPYLDEGITSAYEIRYMKKKYPDKKLWEIFFRSYKLAKFFNLHKIPVERTDELEWLKQARTNTEQPINLSSTALNSVNYDRMVYNKAGHGFNYLRAYLGDSVFDSAMRDFYRTWKFRHPQPEDLRKSFESISGKKLSWFFDDFLATVERMDYKLVKINDHQLLIENVGELQSPLIISGMREDSVIWRRWIEGFKGGKWVDIPGGNYSTVKIDPDHILPEINRENNTIRREGILKTWGPLRTQFYFTLEDFDKPTIMYFPVVNWTRENSLMLGMAFHNGFILPKRFEYFIMPFYSFNSTLAGYGKISWNLIPYNQLFRMVTFSLEGTQFGAPGNQNYKKIKLSTYFHFRTNESDDPTRQAIYLNYVAASDLAGIISGENARLKSFWQGGYTLVKKSMVNPYSIAARLELSDDYLKALAEICYRVSYYGKNNGLDLRLFSGKMINNRSAAPLYNLAPSGRSGNEEYFFQGTFPDRFTSFPSTFWSRQMTLDEGGIITPINQKLGFSDWLISLTLTSDLPGRLNLPFKGFTNLLLNDHGFNNDHAAGLLYEAGIKAGIWNIFEVYFPFLVSENIRVLNQTFKDRFRFIFKIDGIFQIRKKRL